MSSEPRLAVFVSPHGFGHAARASALMGSLHGLCGARFELFAATPRWFFDESVEGLYEYHELVTDVGFVQRSALAYDLSATVEALNELVPFDDELVTGLAAEVKATGCRAVICDISPLGIAVAERAGIPSVLVENFTWPWLYESLAREEPRLAGPALEMGSWFDAANIHVQTEPLCQPDPVADLHAPPMSRPPRNPRHVVRQALGLPIDGPVVVLTMGGVPEALPFLDKLRAFPEVHFLVTGAAESEVQGNLHLFDKEQRIYMPDLVRAADAVVAKAGYSTVAEVWREGPPLAFVTRADFRETGPLRDFVQRELTGFEIPGAEFADGAWVERIPELLVLPREAYREEGGADEVAEFLMEALPLDGASAG